MQEIGRGGSAPRLLGAAILVALGLLAVWAMVPDVALGALLLLAVSADLILAGVFYAVERRRHW